MRHARRLIAILIGCATYCAAAATTAYAQLATRPDPGGGVVITPPSQTSVRSSDTSVWEFIGVAALGALLAVAVVGLVLSLRHRRTSDRSPALRA